MSLTVGLLTLCCFAEPTPTPGGTFAEPWIAEDRLWGSDQQLFGGFASSVALDADTAIVGSLHADVDGNDGQGEAYLFVRAGSAWLEQVRLEALDGGPFHRFGRSVALEDDRAIVGASGWYDGQGAVYTYLREGLQWTLEQQLFSSDGDDLDEFGFSVSIDEEILVIGARSEEGAIAAAPEGCQGSGAVYVFELERGGWSEATKMFDPAGQCGDSFGHDVHVGGARLLVGAPLTQIGANLNQGLAHVFRRMGSAWVPEQVLEASDPEIHDQLGSAVAMDGATALVGAPEKPIDGKAHAGAVYVFERDGTTWTETQRLTASDGQTDSRFGSELALEGNTALIAAKLDLGVQNMQGVVYEFRRVDGVWMETQRFQAPEGGHGLDTFGKAMALTRDRAIVGHGSVDLVPPGGTAWILLRPPIFADGFESGDTGAWDHTVD